MTGSRHPESQVGMSPSDQLILPRQEALLFHLHERRSISTHNAVRRCGMPLDSSSKHPERRFYCENRWCDRCHHRRTSKLAGRIPDRAFEEPSWSLGTLHLGSRSTVSEVVVGELKAAAKELREALPSSIFSGGLYFYELAFDDSPTGIVMPHVHFVLGSKCEWAVLQDGWYSTLDRLGIEHAPESLMWIHDRMGILHYSQKRWRDDRPIPFRRALEQIRAFQGVPLTGRFRCFRHPSRRNRS